MLLMRNSQKLSSWLEAELKTREWTQSDLARISGIHRGIISKIILGGSQPTPETMEAIARALKLPPEHVFRAAGILPPITEINEETEQIIYESSKLNPQDRAEVIAYIRMKQNLRKKNGRN